MKHTRRTAVLTVLFSLFTGLILAEKQPQMHDALEALRRARLGKEPAKNLGEASKALAHSTRDKAHYRREALSLVEKAEGAVTAKDFVSANKFIDEAIAKIEKGIEAGKRKK